MPPVITFLSEKLYGFSCHPLAWSLLSAWGLVTALSGGWSADVGTMYKEFSPKDVVPSYSSAPAGDEEQRLSSPPLPAGLGGAGLYISWRDAWVQTVNFATGWSGGGFRHQHCCGKAQTCPGALHLTLWCWRPCIAGSQGWEAHGKDSFSLEWCGSDGDGSSIVLGQPRSTFLCLSFLHHTSHLHCGAVSGMLHLQPSLCCSCWPGEGAELPDGWSLSLRRIAVAVPCGHGFGALRFILNMYHLSVLHFLGNSCTVLYGLSGGEKIILFSWLCC